MLKTKGFEKSKKSDSEEDKSKKQLEINKEAIAILRRNFDASFQRL